MLSFDSMPRDLIERAVAHHTDLAWVKLYVGRWLRAPVEHPNGTLEERTKGTPQGGVVALRGRCPRPLRERGGSAVCAGGDPGSSRGVRSGASSHDDPDRLLQGRRPAG